VALKGIYIWTKVSFPISKEGYPNHHLLVQTRRNSMKILLDTNIIIHRESSRVTNTDIGILFRWLDNLHYTKCIHSVTVSEINKLQSSPLRDTFNLKLTSYNLLQVQSPLAPSVKQVSDQFDANDNDRNDTFLLNELFLDRVDLLITEDRKIGRKAQALGIGDRVFTIDGFLEKVTAENPGLIDYKVLAVKKELFGNINLNDEFFDSFKEDYPRFDRWFNKKSDETAYVCKIDEKIVAFLYLKIENQDEPYPDITPRFLPKRRLKIGTLKVTLNGLKLGERFLKIIFDNALVSKVDEIYVTIFEKRMEQERLVDLLQDFGFTHHGIKSNPYGNEAVYVRPMARTADITNPKQTYPFFSRKARAFIVPIYPEYHTNLFPDSILRTESPLNFEENKPFSNAISKVYISRSINRDLRSGDTIVFYRTGGYYKGVVSTLGIVESVITNIKSADDFIRLCRKRSVFTDEQLLEQWNYKSNRPFIVNFLYIYSFPKRINMQRLIELGIIKDVGSAPRGFEIIGQSHLASILKETQSNESIAVD
jgi:predicted nucleic acid-binding protein